MYNRSKDTFIETNRFEVNQGKTLINRRANFKQQIRIIPKSAFKNSYETSFFVRRQIGIRRLSVMMGCDTRIGENSPFNRVLSKDVTRWLLKKYVTAESQCCITTKPTKIWISRELTNTDYDLVFTDVLERHEVIHFIPHFITTELVMYPIVIQTPKIGLLDWVVCDIHKNRVRGIFDPRSKRLVEEFTNTIDIIDMRCREWILQNLKKITGITLEQVNFEWINRYYDSSRGKFLIEDIQSTYKNGLSLMIRDNDNISFFDKDGVPSKKTKNQFFGDNYESKNRFRWVKFIVVLESFIKYDEGVTPYWKVLQCKEVEPPKISPDYGFLSSDEE